MQRIVSADGKDEKEGREGQNKAAEAEHINKARMPLAGGSEKPLLGSGFSQAEPKQELHGRPG